MLCKRPCEEGEKTSYWPKKIFENDIFNRGLVSTTKLKNLAWHFTEENIQVANKHMRRCSTWLAIREMEIKTTIRYHYTCVRMTEMKKCDSNMLGRTWRNCHTYIADGNVNYHSHSGKQCGWFLTILNVLTVWHSSNLLDIYPKEMKTIFTQKLFSNVHNSFVLCSQKIETTLMSFN